MNQYYSVYYFASTYGSGDYSDQTYGCTQGVTNCSTVQGSSTLVNTGIAVAGFVTVACLIIFIALVVRIWKRKAKHTPTQPTATTRPDGKLDEHR